VARPSLAPEIVGPRDGDTHMQVEAVDLDGALVARRRLDAVAVLVVGVIAKRPNGSALHADRGARFERGRLVLAQGRGSGV
jgi:hypothetical protein